MVSARDQKKALSHKCQGQIKNRKHGVEARSCSYQATTEAAGIPLCSRHMQLLKQDRYVDLDADSYLVMEKDGSFHLKSGR